MSKDLTSTIVEKITNKLGIKNEEYLTPSELVIVDVVKDALIAYPGQHWIPCSDRLPEDDVEVFVYLFERQTPYIAWVEDCRWYTEDFEVEKENYPTAWMPLPEPGNGD